MPLVVILFYIASITPYNNIGTLITDVVGFLRRMFGSIDTQEPTNDLCLLLFHDSNVSIPRKVSRDTEMMKMFMMVLNRCDHPKVKDNFDWVS